MSVTSAACRFRRPRMIVQPNVNGFRWIRFSRKILQKKINPPNGRLRGALLDDLALLHGTSWWSSWWVTTVLHVLSQGIIEKYWFRPNFPCEGGHFKIFTFAQGLKIGLPCYLSSIRQGVLEPRSHTRGISGPFGSLTIRQHDAEEILMKSTGFVSI